MWKIRKSNKQKILASFLAITFLMQPFIVAYGQEEVLQSLDSVPPAENIADPTTSSSGGEMDSTAETSAVPITSVPTVSEQIIEPVAEVPLVTDLASEVNLETQVPDVTVPEILPESKDILPLEINASSVQSEEKPTSYENSNFVYKKTITPEANLASGALSYSYSITTPPGRAGVEPSLSISYNSSENSNINIVGYGWDFNIPTIERINKQGNVAMYNQDYFTSSLSGELASTTISGLYRPRVDSGEFLKYFYSATSTSWKVYDKQGKTYTFGSVVNSRNADPSNSSRVAKWYLDEIRDSNGNYISYNYSVIGGQVYPTEIIYTNHEASSGAVTSGIYKVNFLYEDTRTDNAIRSYKWAFLSTNARRLKTIEVKIDNSTIRKYDFSYGTGVNGIRSLLTSVTETGYSSEGLATTIPSTIFEYTKGFENSVLPTGLDPANSSGKFSYALGSLFYGPERSGKVYADLNGDGYTDSFVLSVNPYESSSFSVQVDWNRLGLSGNNALPYLRFAYVNRGPNSSNPEDTGARVADFNGDGFSDFVGIPTTLFNAGNCTLTTCPPPPNPPTLYTHSGINNIDNSYTYIATTTSIFPISKGSFLGDLDGSGLPKIYEKRTYLNDTNINNYQTSAVDINGDGLDDINTSERYISIKINTGGSFGPINQPLKSSLDQPIEFNDREGNDTGVRYLDINADGLIDVVRGWVLPNTPNFDNGYGTGDFNEVYINTGNEFVKSSTLKSPYFIKISPWNSKWWFQYQMTDYYDTNGDGLSDIPNGPTTKADILKTITYPLGGQTLVEYTTSASGKKLNLKLPHNLWIVSKITTTDGVGGEAQVGIYTYADGQNFFNGPYDRKFAGFGKVTKEDDSSVVVSYFHQGNGDNSQNGEVGDSYGKIGSMYKTEIFDKEGKLFARTQNIYSEAPLSGVNSVGYTSSTPVFVYLSKKVEESFDGTSGHKDRATEYIYDSSNGNLLSVIDYGEVNSSLTSTTSSLMFSDFGNDKLITNFEYASDVGATATELAPTHYEVSRKILIKNGDSDPIGESRLYFDDLPLGQVGKGNVTKQENLVELNRYITTSQTYNNFGLVENSVDGNGNRTSYVYDQYNLLPISVTNALNHKTEYAYDYALQKLTQVTDANKQIYTKKYDGFGRVVEERHPDGNATVAVGGSAPLVVKTIYQYIDTPNNVSVKKIDFINNSLSNEVISYFDGIGRETQVRKQSENPTTFIVTDTIYNSDGRVLKQSLPYFNDGISKTSATNDDTLYTSFVYDALGRNIQKTDTLGVTHISYTPGQTKTMDTLQNSKVYHKDVFGRLIRVEELNYPDTYSTQYEYDSLNNLIKITDALGNIRNFTYDLLNRRISAEDLHSLSDNTFGIYTYKYDNVGNLKQKTDPNGTQISYTYDQLNRLVRSEVVSTNIANISIGVKNTYLYDSCDFAVGKICSIDYVDDSNPKGAESNSTVYVYNPKGQVKSETKKLYGKSFVSSYLYNLGGGVTEMIGADSHKTSYTYNSAGFIDSISATGVSTTTSVVQISAFDYSPLGQPKTVTYGNGSVTTNVYDSTQLYRLKNKKTTSVSGKNLQDLNYTYDSVGNILQILDNSETSKNKASSYYYDDLYRMVLASTTAYRQSFKYDALGNLTEKKEGAMIETPASLEFSALSSQYAFAQDSFGLNGDSNMSVSMWAKFLNLPANNQVYGLFGHNSSSSKIYTAIEYLDSGNGVPKLRFFRLGANLAQAEHNVNLNDGKWHHISYTYNNSNSTFLAYLDGVLVGSGNVSVNNGNRGNDHTIIGNIDMGGDTFAPAPYYLDGKIDGVYIYNRTLSSEEIERIYTSKDEASKQEIGLVAYYNLNNSYTNLISKSAGLNPANSPKFSADVPFALSAQPDSVGVLTTYQYGGREYANPHAPTLIGSIATSTLSYDKAGNLIAFGNTKYSYDYSNRLISVGNGLATSTYAYDHSDTRIKVADDESGMTLYPSKYYNAGYDKHGNKTSETSHIFVGDNLLSTFEHTTPVAPTLIGSNKGTCVIPTTGDWTLSSSCTIVGEVAVPASVIVLNGKVLTVTKDSKLFIDLKKFKLLVKKGGGVLVKQGGTLKQILVFDVTPKSNLSYHLTDHLGSVTLSTNESGNISELTSYYPYGSIREEEGSGTVGNSSSQEQRKYIGQEYDTSTGLSYLNARYYDGNRGQFLNQDPVFWEVGMSKEGKEVLSSPQSQNSYSYSGNNPITYSDPDGRFVPALAALAGAVAVYAPQVTSFAQSLLTPLGQWSIGEAAEDFERGNYKMAAVGFVSAGEFKGASKVLSGLERQTELISKIGEGANSKVVNLIKDTFKSTDGLLGGTVGAIKNEMMTGQATKGVWHAFKKASNTLGRTDNILRDYGSGKISLKPIEIGIVKGIQKGVERAVANFNKSPIGKILKL